jgi:hypothetical protein
MRISTGLAEIGFAGYADNRIASEKFYLWPQYNAGRVNQIRGVTRHTESNVIYSKPLGEDRDKIMELSRDRSGFEYTNTGRADRHASGIRPGALFDAIV